MAEKSLHAQAKLYFALETLGWHSFQDLCITVAKHSFGQIPVTFLPSKDRGRDGAFYGNFSGPSGTQLNGVTTIQCKHTSSGTANLSAAAVKDELSKAKRLVLKGYADNYVLMTNYGVSGPVEEELRAQFLKTGVKKFLALGRDWMNQELRESPKLRMMVPRVYGLGDLSQIIDERLYDQAREILSTMEDDLSKIVITDAYRQAAQAINDRNFVLLIGEPASGKSLIAASLAMSAIDSWKSPTLKVSNGSEFKLRWNPNERQFFWVDDAFGPTHFIHEMVQTWNSVIPELRSALKKGTRVLFTSRDYIWNAAQHAIKGSAFPVIFDSQVVINVQDLKPDEKRQMLYNHIKLGIQPQPFRREIKAFLEKVAANRSFLPEIARRLGEPRFTKGLALNDASLQSFVENPRDFLKRVIEELDRPCKAALALIFVSGGAVPSPIESSRELELAAQLLGASSSEIRDAMKALNGSLVKRLREGGSEQWTYKHPTVADAFADIVADDPELLHIYVGGAKPDRLVKEIVCGDVGIEGARVIVPSSLFAKVASAVQRLPKAAKLQFLSTRCDKGFLEQYISIYPELSAEISKFASFSLAFSPEILTAAKLRIFGLLNGTTKEAVIAAIREIAIERPDMDFLKPQYIGDFLTSEETDQMLKNVRDHVVPVAADLIRRRERSYDTSETPNDYFGQLVEVLETLQDRYGGDDSEVSAVLSDAIIDAYGAMEDAQRAYDENHPDEDDGREFYEDSTVRNSTVYEAERSIFDDVDE